MQSPVADPRIAGCKRHRDEASTPLQEPPPPPPPYARETPVTTQAIAIESRTTTPAQRPLGGINHASSGSPFHTYSPPRFKAVPPSSRVVVVPLRVVPPPLSLLTDDMDTEDPELKAIDDAMHCERSAITIALLRALNGRGGGFAPPAQ
jgi:hypothetical protein